MTIGAGVILEKGEDLLFEGELNLNMESGKEHYEMMKFAPELVEFSYGFKVLELDEESEWSKNPKVWRVFKKLDIFEVSPVLRGAGIDTALLAIKSDKDKGTTYADQAEAVLAAVKDLVDRTKSLADLRRKEGRDLSPANRERIENLRKDIEETEKSMKDLVVIKEAPEAALDEGAKSLLRLHKLYNEIQEAIN